MDRCHAFVLPREGCNLRYFIFNPIINLSIFVKRKKYHEVDPQEATNALRSLKNEPNFKKYIEIREQMREDTIRQLQSRVNLANPNLIFHLAGKLEAIDEELDNFYNL